MIDSRKLHRIFLRESRQIFLVIAAAVFCLSLGQPQIGHSQDTHEHHRHASSSTKETGEEVSFGRISIPDVMLLNQNGEQVHFYSDLIKGKVVVMNFIFTTCTTICPPMGANFASLQKLMGDRDLNLISISVDPVVDTPQRLKAWSSKFDAGPGWTLLTGPKHDVDKLLKALKVFTPDKWDHSPIVLVGNDAKSKWTRTNGLAPPAKLAEIITDMTSSAAKNSSSEEASQK